MKQLYTRWGRELDSEHVHQEYPRPLLQRKSYINLNGYWEYAITKEFRKPQHYDGRILVPFSPESALSGVGRQLMPDEYLWYRTKLSVDTARLDDGCRLILHFGAVDQACRVYVNGKEAARHTGGYLPFSTDITACRPEVLTQQFHSFTSDSGRTNSGEIDRGKTEYDNTLAPTAATIDEWELVLAVRDLSDTSYHAKGKQKLKRGGMFYTAQSGIWQTVWMEYVPTDYIEEIVTEPDLEQGLVRISIRASSDLPVTIRIKEPALYNHSEAYAESATVNCETAFASAAISPSETICSSAAHIQPPINSLAGSPSSVPGIAADSRAVTNSEAVTDSETATTSGTAADSEAATTSGTAADSEAAITPGTAADSETATTPGTIIEFTGRTNRNLEISLPIIRPWTCDEPYLYYFTVSMGEDVVTSYFALRSFKIAADQNGIPRIFLNGQIQFQNGVLDQGYWPDGLYTAPSDEAYIFDIMEMKKMGFNMLRKHIKIEPRRWYYHCDRLGMIVWQDMVNGGSAYKHWFVTYAATLLSRNHWKIPDTCLRLLSRTHRKGRREFVLEMKETIRLLKGHPSIAVWVIFNEGWGQFHAQEITRIAEECDNSRLIDQASGWFDQSGGHLQSIHHYFFKMKFAPEAKRATVLSEFGGYSLRIPDHSSFDKLYGYGTFKDAAGLKKAYNDRMQKVTAQIPDGLCASVYTQLSDVEEEVNGILTYDREVNKLL